MQYFINLNLQLYSFRIIQYVTLGSIIAYVKLNKVLFNYITDVLDSVHFTIVDAPTWINALLVQYVYSIGYKISAILYLGYQEIDLDRFY